MSCSYRLVVALATTVGLSAQALVHAKAAKTYQVGVISMHIAPDRPQIKGLRDGLREAGYIEGRNVTLDLRLKRSYEDVRAIANVFVQQTRDVIVTTGNAETTAAQEATQRIPIVFIPATDPIRLGFVKSLAKPGANLTGLTYYTDVETFGKQLEIFKDAVPTLRRITLISERKNPGHGAAFVVVRRVASRLAMTLVEKPIQLFTEAEQVVSTLSRNSTDGIFIMCGALFANIKKIGNIAREKRLPLFGCATEHAVEEGALLIYAPNLYQMGRRGAWYVDRILKGTRPQELPVESPTKFELVINLKTARALGLKIPAHILMEADKVIE